MKKELLRVVDSMNLKELPFGIIVDDGASDEATAFAGALHKLLLEQGASECLYVPSTTTFDEILEKHQGDENLDDVVKSELSKEPGKGMKVMIPDMANTDQRHADSLLVEDVYHCKPSMLLKHHVAMPSMFRARQSKHREMVVFDERASYTEYAILFYEYESEEAMRENIPYEYPNNRHGRDDADPMFFLLRDANVGSLDEPKLPTAPVPPPDTVSEGSLSKEEVPLGSFMFV